MPYVSDGAVLGWKTGAPERIFGKMKNSVAMAVVAGALIVAATMAAVFRYEVTPVSTTVAHRFDRWTGKIQSAPIKRLAWNVPMTSHPKRPRDPNQLAGLVDRLG